MGIVLTHTLQCRQHMRCRGLDIGGERHVGHHPIHLVAYLLGDVDGMPLQGAPFGRNARCFGIGCPLPYIGEPSLHKINGIEFPLVPYDIRRHRHYSRTDIGQGHVCLALSSIYDAVAQLIDALGQAESW